MYFKMMQSSCYLNGQGSENQVSTHIVSFCKWSTQNKNKQKPYMTWVFTKVTHSRVTLEEFYSSLK